MRVFPDLKEFSYSSLDTDMGSWSDSNSKEGKFTSVLHTVVKSMKWSSGCTRGNICRRPEPLISSRDYTYMFILDDGRKLEFSWTVGDMLLSRRAQTIENVDEGEFVFSDGDDVSMSISVIELGRVVDERNGRRYSYPQIRYKIAINKGDYELNLQTDKQRGDINQSQLKLLPVVEELEGKVQIDRIDSDNEDAKEGFFKKARRAYMNTALSLSLVGCLVRGGCAGIKEDGSSDEHSDRSDETSQ